MTHDAISRISYFFLVLLKLGKSHIQVLIHVLLPKELHRPLIHLPSMGEVAVFLLEARILDPVLHVGVNEDKFSSC